MKLIAITSSPKGKKSNTLRLVNAAAAAARDEGADVEIIDIARLDLKYCVACNTCFKKGACPRRDDFNKILKKMLAADGFILSSPNYMEDVTGQMKVFMDRHCDVVHCQKYEGKYAIALTTCGNNYGEHVIKVMDTFAVKCGATALGGAGAPLIREPASEAPAIERARMLGMDLVKAIKEKRPVPEQAAAREAARAYFANMFRNNPDVFASDCRYYVKKGWLKAP